MKLGKFFELREFVVSQTAARRGVEIETPPDAVVENLRRLVVTCLDPLRAHLGKPVVVNSGYRPPWLNTMVGGSKTSAHMIGCAADIIVPGVDNVTLAHTCRQLNLPFDQVILEFGNWVHIGIKPAGQTLRRQTLTALKVNHKTKYFLGIVNEVTL